MTYKRRLVTGVLIHGTDSGTCAEISCDIQQFSAVTMANLQMNSPIGQMN